MTYSFCYICSHSSMSPSFFLSPPLLHSLDSAVRVKETNATFIKQGARVISRSQCSTFEECKPLFYLYRSFMQPGQLEETISPFIRIQVSVELLDSSTLACRVYLLLSCLFYRKDEKVTSHEDRLLRLSSAIIATAASVSLESNLCRKVRSDLASE